MTLRAGVVFAALLLAWIAARADDQPSRAFLQQLQQQTLTSGEFEQTRVLQGMPKPLTSSGTFIFWREQGLYLETLEPFYQASTFTETELINWLTPSGAAEPANKGDPVQRYISRILLAVFQADLSALEQLFQSSWELDGPDWSVTLLPASKMVANVIDQVRLEGDTHLRLLEVTAHNGDVNRMLFSALAQEDPQAERCARFSRDGTLRCPTPDAATQ